MTLPEESVSRAPESSNSVSLSFGSWRTPNEDRPVLVLAEVGLDSSGATEAVITFEVDYDGGTTSDESWTERLPAGLGTTDKRLFTFYIQPGMSYRITNFNDPDNGNDIQTHREFVF